MSYLRSSTSFMPSCQFPWPSGDSNVSPTRSQYIALTTTPHRPSPRQLMYHCSESQPSHCSSLSFQMARAYKPENIIKLMCFVSNCDWCFSTHVRTRAHTHAHTERQTITPEDWQILLSLPSDAFSSQPALEMRPKIICCSEWVIKRTVMEVCVTDQFVSVIFCEGGHSPFIGSIYLPQAGLEMGSTPGKAAFCPILCVFTPRKAWLCLTGPAAR